MILSDVNVSLAAAVNEIVFDTKKVNLGHDMSSIGNYCYQNSLNYGDSLIFELYEMKADFVYHFRRYCDILEGMVKASVQID